MQESTVQGSTVTEVAKVIRRAKSSIRPRGVSATVLRGVLSAVSIMLLVAPPLLLSGCKELTGTQSLPSGVHNPSYYNTPSGALGMRNAADSMFENALLGYIIDSGLLSDELEKSPFLGTQNGIPIQVTSSLDQRILLANGSGIGGGGSYVTMQKVRVFTNQAIGGLAAYYPSASPALRGEMYAIQGYAEIMLADLICSGIPLSTVDFNADFTYKAGSPKEQVYQDAIAKFDTALALSSDSIRIMNLARVGIGRAQLALGNYAEAAQAVSSVPDGYQYQVMVQWAGSGNGITINNPFNGGGTGSGITASDNEGVNGLPFILSHDPRTTAFTFTTSGGSDVQVPSKYQAGLTAPYYSPIVLASAIEARLIQAEAALHAGDTTAWLNALNQIRTVVPPGVTPVIDTVADTLGITGCTAPSGAGLCGHSPGGSTPDFGQPPGGFHPPAGHVLMDSIMITLPFESEQYSTCSNNSWYEPCYDNGQTIIYRYVTLTAGSGGVVGLDPLPDPGTDTGRVSLMFRERAYWLYMTGHRQGDLRRLIRQYHRDQSQVYPVGDYLPSGQGFYGNDVTVPIGTEESPNPLFHGCIDRNA